MTKSKSIQDLRDSIMQESCIKKEPFIKLGEGKAPTLSYNIPQNSCFHTYGREVVKGVNEEWFLERTKVAPANNYFVKV